MLEYLLSKHLNNKSESVEITKNLNDVIERVGKDPNEVIEKAIEEIVEKIKTITKES